MAQGAVESPPAAAGQGHPRPRRVARLLSWAAVVLLASVTVLAVVGYLLLDHYDAKVARLPGVVDTGPGGEVDTGPGAGTATGPGGEDVSSAQPLNVLVVGSDSREGLTGEEAFQGTGSEFITGQRSDVVILAHLYAGRQAAQLVSLPRDAYVQIPAHADAATGENVPARPDRLNSAFADGGPPLLVETVQQLTGLRVDHYVQVDFRGFKTLVDALGGVEVCLTEPQRDFRSGIDLPAGRQTVQGEQALAFVRQRTGLPRGDIDRIRRQQLLLGALVREVLSAGTLLNPVRLNGVLQAGTASLQVDETLTTSRLRRLALGLRGLDAADVVFTTAPVADLNAERGGASVVLLDEQRSAELFARLRADIPPPPPAAPPSEAPVDDERTAADAPCA